MKFLNEKNKYKPVSLLQRLVQLDRHPGTLDLTLFVSVITNVRISLVRALLAQWEQEFTAAAVRQHGVE